VRFAGEFAALGTAVCWAGASNFFTAAGRRMGSLVLNRLRLLVGSILLLTALWIVKGSPWPTWATGFQLGALALSGLIGFVFGDSYNFRSMVILGPGRASLLASTAPVFTVALGWPLLHEKPGPFVLLGLVLTLGGVAWVIRERGLGGAPHREGSTWMGIVAGVLGAIGQAGGFVLSRAAVQSGIDPLSGTVIRIVAAAAAIWIWTLARGEGPRTMSALGDRRGALLMLCGTVCGPLLGVTLSLTALMFVQAGVAASITAFFPVLAILIGARFHKEPITAGTILGALVAATGVVVLFLRG
jgi:drug/metabolite transporter (DMT)-like permease